MPLMAHRTHLNTSAAHFRCGLDQNSPCAARRIFVMDTRKTTAETYHKSFNYPDPDSYQKEFNYGQARINFELNEVDKDFVKALKVIVEALKTIKALPQFTHELRAIDFTEVEKALTDAEQRSKTVADIRPPGCEGPYPS